MTGRKTQNDMPTAPGSPAKRSLAPLSADRVDDHIDAAIPGQGADRVAPNVKGGAGLSW